MKIVSWNVNGLRAVLKNREKSLKAFLDDLHGDIICLQETKATREQLDSSCCVADGYTSFFSFCKVKGGYSGVVTFCRGSATPVRAEEGLTGVLTDADDGVGLTGDCHTHFTCKEDMLSFDGEGRAVLTEHICDWRSADGEGGRVGGGGEGERGREGTHLVVINIYCPMVDRDNVKAERLDYKLLFYSVLQDRCTALEQAGKEVIVAGDLNCSREAIDSAYIQDTPTLLYGCPEREWMSQFVTSHPPQSPPSLPAPSILIDTFRHLHPTQSKAYTCWSTLLGYRKTNHGTRIDYILCSTGLVPLLSGAEVCAHVAGSDHCPVMAEFATLDLSPSPKAPALSSALLLGRQMKLSTFMTPRLNTIEETVGGQRSRSEVGKVVPVTRGNSKMAAKSRKRKTSGYHLPSSKSRRAATLKTFFNSSSSSSTNTSSQTGSDVTIQQLDQAPSCDLTTEGGETGERAAGREAHTLHPDPPAGAASSSQLSTEWLAVFSGPPRPPICKGHNEPATLRTVRKSGPNRGRQFWVCSRPGGSKSDPATQCDFFEWLTHSKLKTT